MSNDQPDDEIIPNHGCPQPGVNAVENTTMTRDQLTRVFDAALTFYHALTQVTQCGDSALEET